MRKHESQGYSMSNLESQAFGVEMNSWVGGRRVSPIMFTTFLRAFGPQRDVAGHEASRGSSKNVSITSARFKLMTTDSLMGRAVAFLV